MRRTAGVKTPSRRQVIDRRGRVWPVSGVGWEEAVLGCPSFRAAWTGHAEGRLGSVEARYLGPGDPIRAKEAAGRTRIMEMFTRLGERGAPAAVPASG